MKKLFILFLLLLFVYGCSESVDYFSDGFYDDILLGRVMSHTLQCPECDTKVRVTIGILWFDPSEGTEEASIDSFYFPLTDSIVYFDPMVVKDKYNNSVVIVGEKYPFGKEFESCYQCGIKFSNDFYEDNFRRFINSYSGEITIRCQNCTQDLTKEYINMKKSGKHPNYLEYNGKRCK